MHKNYFIHLSEYNIWANNTVISWCHSVSEDNWSKTLESSFPSIKATIFHIAAAEFIWNARLLSQEASFPKINDQDTKDDILQYWMYNSSRLLQIVQELPNDAMDHWIHIQRQNGEESSLMIKSALAHIINHSTYHRGQVVTLLRQVGYNDFTSIDLLAYDRSHPIKY